ncbi:MAG: hypothetical protein KZQ86_00430 [Candidatus Thiodiazotropha sp. (ex Lucinoma kastoroae)]|nr:hypothetical protein [Candidatus Thiodiazotropha sp. (ex Lucinoma kastoroae)]
MNKKDKEYFDALAGQLTRTFTSSQEITKFTSNKDVIGAYTEELVYNFVSNVVYPLRVSTGTVISRQSYKNDAVTPQLDIIIWDPNPVPPILSENRFSLVPRNAVLGIIEVKKTDYNNGLDDIRKKEKEVINCFSDVNPNKLYLGVICSVVNKNPLRKNKLTSLIKEKKAVYLLDNRIDTPIPNPPGIYRLINFLGMVRKSAKKRSTEYTLNYPNSKW